MSENGSRATVPETIYPSAPSSPGTIFTVNTPEPESRVCSGFSDQSANVVLQSSDKMIFFVEDYYLKANSGFFRDMLTQSVASSLITNPIVLDEFSEDIETLLIVISGHPCQASERCTTWTKARHLYRLMQKYQLDRLQSWFSFNAGRYAQASPLEALCLATNNPCFDEHLVQCAIVDGMGRMNAQQLFDDEYFVEDKALEPIEIRKAYLLSPGNMTVKLGVELGFKGMMGYCRAFSELKCAEGEKVLWQGVAELFIATARGFEAVKGSSVSHNSRILLPLHVEG